jgi:hypothetical protein
MPLFTFAKSVPGFTVLGGFMSLALLSACGPQAASVADPAGESSQDIVGGQATNGFHAVGLLVNYSPDGNTMSLCTASLVAPHTLLTAAHCVMAQGNRGTLQAAAASPPNLVFYTGASTTQSFDPQRAFAASNVILPGGAGFPFAAFVASVRGGSLNDDDLALVTLQRAPPIAPLRLANTAPNPGEGLLLVGYGTQGGSNGAGTKRVTHTHVVGLVDRYLLQAGSRKHGTCSGDSGGPALNNGHIVGITQAGEVDSAGNCLGTDYFTRVDAYVDFIAANAT